MQDSRSFRKFKKGPLFVSLALLAASIFSFLFLYRETNNNIASAETAEASWQREISRQEEISSLNRLIEDARSEITLLGSHFAEGANVVPFLDTLEKLATSVSAKPEILSVEVAKDKSGLTVSLKAVGSFEAIYKFLLLLENSPYELEFISADLVKAGSGVGEWTGNFKIKLLSFFP